MKRSDLLRAAVLAVLLIIILILFLKDSGPQSSQKGSTPADGQSSVARTDANGVAWTLDQAGGALLSTEPNAPKAGPPILVKTDVQQVGDHEMSIGLLLEGQAGEQYRPVVKKNGSPLSAPQAADCQRSGPSSRSGRFPVWLRWYLPVLVASTKRLHGQVPGPGGHRPRSDPGPARPALALPVTAYPAVAEGIRCCEEAALGHSVRTRRPGRRDALAAH